MTHIYLSQGASVLLIPVTPSEITVSDDGKIETFDTVDGGDIVHIGRRGLRKVAWSSFFPQHPAPYVLSRAMRGMEYVTAINLMRDARAPLRLTVPELGISMLCAVASFEWSQKKGVDIPYSIQLTEYKGLT